jgi:UDP-GlcNAc:undecaprenyl-phosphate/decaprenyl-phosphate GlcNAc-1-phosphate transferase
MKIQSSNQSESDGVALLIVITVLLTGMHGLLSIFILMITSRLNIGRDPKGKHGVSSGASRLGGVAILFSILSGMMLNMYLTDNLNYESMIGQINPLLLLSICVGLIGLIDDLRQNLSSLLRLVSILAIIMISLVMVPYLLPLELPIFMGIEGSIKVIFIYFFTTIMVSGFVNAGNIADGANGLLSLSYLAFFYCLNILDPSVLNLSIIISLLIFVIYNISTGRVFLGDFGAYFLSALVAFSCLDVYQNNEISIFFFAAVLVYPCFEITRSLVFRIFSRVSIMSPDNNHLHNKLNNYFLNNGLNLHQSNSMTGIFLACISSALPAYLFINENNYSDNLWFGLFIFEFLVLSSIYLLLSKINLKKI